MPKRILVTGGSGFIGSHLVDKLVEKGHEVTVLDNLEPQVHADKPDYLNDGAKYVNGDVRDRATLVEHVKDKDWVYHQAAMVGVGQSMYQVDRYVDVNTLGTARLLDVLVNEEHDVKKMVVASSMSIYGEGAYVDQGGNPVLPELRTKAQMERGDWEVKVPGTGEDAVPRPTPESKPLESTSVYALSKKDQEEYTLVVGKAYGLPVVALRYFNVYGPRQSLNNPYTGVCAIFSSRIKNGNPPVVYEDGKQTRDFVSVHDIVQGNLLAMEKSGADYEAVNIGTGNPQTILGVADTLIKLYGREGELKPEVAGKYRSGDIRHCVADITKAREKLGYAPKVDFEDGMRELVEWGEQVEAKDLFEQARSELKRRGLE